MDELAKLQEELRILQEEDTSHTLSERNCVEIILKLQQMKMVDLIYSIDGKQYITPDQLITEIVDEVDSQSGRLNTVDLPALLNVELSHITQKTNELVRKKKDFQLLDGEIIRDYYLDLVAEEISETLLEDGQFKISDLASRFSLSTEFMTNLIETRLGKQLQGKLEGGFLYTQAYISRLESIIRGAFSAITIPTPLYSIMTQFSIPENLFNSISEKLIKDKMVSGTVQGKTQLFIPTIFLSSRQKYIETFYSNNSYILYDDLEKLYITDTKEFLKSKFNDGIALNQIFLSPTIISNMEASVLEAIEASTWVNIMDHLPSMMDQSDTFLCIQNSKPIQKEIKNGNATSLTDTLLISTKLVDKCFQLIQDYLKENFQKSLASSTNPTSKDVIEQPSNDSQNLIEEDLKEKRGRSRAKGSSQQPVVEEELEEETKGRGKGRGGNVKGKRRGGKGDDEPKSSTPSKKSASKQKSSSSSSKITPEEEEKIIQLLKRNIEESSSDEGEEVVMKLYSLLKNKIIEFKEQQSRSVFLDTSKQKKTENFLDTLDDLYANFQVFLNAIPTFSGESEILEKHLLKSLGLLIFNKILEYQAVQQFVDISKYNLEFPNPRQQAINSLQNQKSLEKLNKILSGKSCQDFLNELQTVCDDYGIKLKKLDKKRERQLIFNQKHNLLSQLENEQDPSAAFHLVIVLIYLRCYGVVLHAPGRSIAPILSQLSSYQRSSSSTTTTQTESNNKKESGKKGGKNSKEDKSNSSSSSSSSSESKEIKVTVQELQFLNNFHQRVVKYLTEGGSTEENLNFFKENIEPLKNLVRSNSTTSSLASSISSNE